MTILKHTARPLRIALTAWGALLCCANASAAISDTIHPFVAIGYTYDDNLLRLSDEAGDGMQRSDRARQAQGGLLFDRPFGRQRLTGHAKVSRVTFDHYSQLDYNGKDFAADLAWQLGNRLSGNAGGVYTETLTPFSDFHTSERNLREQRRYYVNGAWRFHPSWQVRGVQSRSRFEYELAAQRVNNRTEDVSEIGVDYLASSGSRVGIVARRIEGKYLNPRFINGIPLQDNFSQDELKANILWLVSGVTQVNVLAGYAERKHDYFVGRDAGGANGRIALKWAPLNKVAFNVQLWREFAAVESVVVSNSLNKGASLGATWDISAKLQASASVRRENRQFEQLSNVASFGDASDRLRSANLGLTWSARPNIQFSANAFHDQRTGSQLIGTSDYRANGVSMNVSAQF